MKALWLGLLVLVASPAFAHEERAMAERTISQASDLVPWCKTEAEARYAAMSMPTYQWQASFHDSGNTLFVDGTLRVHDKDVPVHCRIARGAREKYASIEIDD